MTYRQICSTFFSAQRDEVKNMSESTSCKLLVRACPWIKMTARIEAGDYLELEPSSLNQDNIQKYLCREKDYDTIEIGRIVKTLKDELCEK
jgi:hypothetical protein